MLVHRSQEEWAEYYSQFYNLLQRHPASLNTIEQHNRKAMLRFIARRLSDTRERELQRSLALESQAKRRLYKAEVARKRRREERLAKKREKAQEKREAFWEQRALKQRRVWIERERRREWRDVQRKISRLQEMFKVAKENAEDDARNHDLKPENPGDSNILSDIQWVYENFQDLFQRGDMGEQVLNPELIEKAPSGGAVTLATYALQKRDAFVEKFAIKLLPRDTGKVVDDDREGDAKKLDPGLAELSDFFEEDSNDE